MIAHVKQSGELLSAQGETGQFWTPNGIRASVDKVAAAHRRWNQLGLRGLMLVSGAGNQIRGDELRKQKIATGYEDVLGRIATVSNTLVLAASLKDRKVPVSVFIADNMAYRDAQNVDLAFEPYDPCAVMEAYARERVVLVGGGTGKNGQTTDTAVMEYAAWQKEHAPDENVVVLKGTKFDGVYAGDPAKDANLPRYSIIPAQMMLDEYERFGVVDRKSLEIIRDTGVSLRVYADGHHDLVTVLDGGKDDIGTLIVGDDIEPQLAA